MAPLSKTDICIRRHATARHYIAKVDHFGRIVITLPRGGTLRTAVSFANSNRVWLVKEQRKMKAAHAARSNLNAGDKIWFRGEKTTLRVTKSWGRPILRFGEHAVPIADENMNLARPLLQYLRPIAAEELTRKTMRFAKKLGHTVRKIVIRDQRTQWGSCSEDAIISLNWRLILAPDATADYIILHELMHLREMNHSDRFWRLVETVCPDHEEHDAWLDNHQDELAWGYGLR